MKIPLLLLTLLLGLMQLSCGPSENELRAELRSIDGELMMLRNAAYQYQSQMSQAEFNAMIGSFATGYGITSGESGLAMDGAVTVAGAASNYDTASYSLEQIKRRQTELMKRRAFIVAKLK